MRRFIWLVIFTSFLWLFPKSAIAAGEFQADYDVRYDVAPSGSTIVTQNVTLTNKLTNLYPKQYSIIIDSDKITDVIASDGGGVINANVSLKDGKTTIALAFNQQVVGVGKKTFFTLRYLHSDIAHKNGRIWEINVPGVENDPDLGSYRVALTVPPSFGPNAYLSPIAEDHGYWTKNQMVQGGISAAYGEAQVFLFNLHYAIVNSAVANKRAEIALPPDTPYQEVFITSLEPQPKTVTRDADGNWLAQYDLLAGQKMDINAALTITVFLRPKVPQKPQNINPADYVKALTYWEVYDPKIVALAKQYKTPRDIYSFVVSKLSYDYARVSQNPTRRGALGALSDPTKSICMEFTDLFIAIARAAGIPAREVVGFAYTTNSRLRPLSLVSDVLHAWPEYYDTASQQWVPIDPTWANTTGGVNYFDKLDFNHVAFAIHGLSSEYPYPAGFYRTGDQNGKDIQVRLVDQTPESSANPLAIAINFPKKITGGVSASGEVTVQNTGGKNVPEATISIQSFPGGVDIHSTIENIPPYGSIKTPITLVTNGFLEPRQGRILVSANDQSGSFTFTIEPLYLILIPIGGGLIACILLVWLVMKRKALWKSLRH